MKSPLAGSAPCNVGKVDSQPCLSQARRLDFAHALVCHLTAPTADKFFFDLDLAVGSVKKDSEHMDLDEAPHSVAKTRYCDVLPYQVGSEGGIELSDMRLAATLAGASPDPFTHHTDGSWALHQKQHKPPNWHLPHGCRLA